MSASIEQLRAEGEALAKKAGDAESGLRKVGALAELGAETGRSRCWG